MNNIANGLLFIKKNIEYRFLIIKYIRYLNICYLITRTHPNPSLLCKEGLKASPPLLLLCKRRGTGG
jgi:hypothetical protein